MDYSLLSQIGSSLFQLTSLQYGDYNLADLAAQAQTAFLNSTFVHILEIISALITGGLLIASVIFVQKRNEFSAKMAAAVTTEYQAAQPENATAMQWQDILRHIESTREGEWKFAVIEADTLVDNLLKNYFPGDTMGERLMNIDKTKLLSIDDLWEAHKIRNRLAHDPNYFLRHAEAFRAIKLFEKTLLELGVISQ